MNISLIKSMCHSPVHNYAIPGLTSYLVGESSKKHGTARLFHMTRTHEERIVPHSHRFDFTCHVLKGKVRNSVWKRRNKGSFSPDFDLFNAATIQFKGMGEYERLSEEQDYFARVIGTYCEGESYSMRHDEIHSIEFTKDTQVLFFEGPQLTEQSVILEPIVDGQVIPTFKTEDWMFKKTV